MRIQAQIPAALAALHNFIRQYDPEEIRMFKDDQPFDFPTRAHLESAGELGRGRVRPDERAPANERRDRIAAAMWEQYQCYIELLHA